MVTSIEVKIVKIVNMGVPNGNPYNISIKLWSHTLATQGRETWELFFGQILMTFTSLPILQEFVNTFPKQLLSWRITLWLFNIAMENHHVINR